MHSSAPRLRMFAGPNGSGKSTFKSIIRRELLGIYINPDDIEKDMRDYGFVDLAAYSVSTKVSLGGHSVPEEKISSRYKRSLDLLYQAVKATHRAYIFDNSTHEHIWLAEITNGHTLEMKTDQMPAWFKQALWDKLNANK
jgi:predicted ABC-type ATPase